MVNTRVMHLNLNTKKVFPILYYAAARVYYLRLPDANNPALFASKLIEELKHNRIKADLYGRDPSLLLIHSVAFVKIIAGETDV